MHEGTNNTRNTLRELQETIRMELKIKNCEKKKQTKRLKIEKKGMEERE